MEETCDLAAKVVGATMGKGKRLDLRDSGSVPTATWKCNHAEHQEQALGELHARLEPQRAERAPSLARPRNTYSHRLGDGREADPRRTHPGDVEGQPHVNHVTVA